MANMRAIRTQIKSVKNTQQITKAMKMVSASKLRRTQGAMIAIRPYRNAVEKVIEALYQASDSQENPLLVPHKNVQKVCYVLFVGNRGLCGMYNSEVLKFLMEQVSKETREVQIVVCGRWGKDLLKDSKFPVVKYYDELSDTPDGAQATEVSCYLQEQFLSGAVDEIYLVYQKFVSALSQQPTVTQLLPAGGSVMTAGSAEENKSGSSDKYDFYPDASSVLANVLQIYLDNKVLSVMLEARSGEHSARMNAMSNATDNTVELISTLTLELNRARQAAITTEISEIVGGASALKKKKQN